MYFNEHLRGSAGCTHRGGHGSSSPHALEGLGIGRCRCDGGVDKEDEGAGGGGAPAVSRKTRARVMVVLRHRRGRRGCKRG